ncbi:hypothetical protein [Deinococcus petrolearius]|uniref:Uncharacterized protein n=1 Tax=Deinococcus petrolearius TaxID=1751295 RepID=A0ABW1DGD4_9DEIO
MNRTTRVWLLVALLALGVRAQAEGGNVGGGGWSAQVSSPPGSAT